MLPENVEFTNTFNDLFPLLSPFFILPEETVPIILVHFLDSFSTTLSLASLQGLIVFILTIENDQEQKRTCNKKLSLQAVKSSKRILFPILELFLQKIFISFVKN